MGGGLRGGGGFQRSRAPPRGIIVGYDGGTAGLHRAKGAHQRSRAPPQEITVGTTGCPGGGTTAGRRTSRGQAACSGAGLARRKAASWAGPAGLNTARSCGCPQTENGSQLRVPAGRRRLAAPGARRQITARRAGGRLRQRRLARQPASPDGVSLTEQRAPPGTEAGCGGATVTGPACLGRCPVATGGAGGVKADADAARSWEGKRLRRRSSLARASDGHGGAPRSGTRIADVGAACSCAGERLMPAQLPSCAGICAVRRTPVPTGFHG